MAITNPQTLSQHFELLVPQIEDEMRAVIDTGSQPVWFNTMLNYHLGFSNSDGTPARVNSGKRIRPVLTLLCCEACGADWQMALPAAAAIELLHNFSLIHDDLEDRDELRRGRPTVWKMWGEAQAINTGDAMFALSHIALLRSSDRGAPADRVVCALRAFDEMCVKLTIGQHLDLSFESRTDVTSAEYMQMIEGKTAALTSAACEIGAIVGGGDDERIAALAGFGKWLGMSFQLQDDVLGIWGDPAVTGKHDSDLMHRKKTLPVLYAAERNPHVREAYLHNGNITPDSLTQVREMIDASGGRAFAEDAARSAYANALEELESAGLDNSAVAILRELAQSLQGRAN
jgi:geranylgeranyl diphosphate synthase type I